MELYTKPKLCCCLILIIILFSLVLCRNLEVGKSRNGNFPVFTVEFQCFGLDAREAEKLITEPFEKKIRTLSDVYEIRSLSEYGKAATTLYFHKSADTKAAYLELTYLVDTFYTTLPDFVQKPVIYASSVEREPVFMVFLSSKTISLSNLRDFGEKRIKKLFEGIEGIGEVQISGGSPAEVHVKFDSEEIFAKGVSENFLAQTIQAANQAEIGGNIRDANSEIPLFFHTRMEKFPDFPKIPVKVGDGIFPLENLCSVEMGSGKKDSFVRINGTEGITLSVKAGEDGNPIKISGSCNEILASMDLSSMEVTILKDEGKSSRNLIWNVSLSILESFFLVLILLPFFFHSWKKIILIATVIPFSLLCCGGILSLLGLGIDQNVLSGISVSLGLIVDGALVATEISQQEADFFPAMKREVPAIIASCLTTILAMIPLLFFDALSPGIFAVVISIIVMMLFSTLGTTMFFPAFIPKTEKIPTNQKDLRLRFTATYEKLSSKIIDFSLKNSYKVTVLYFSLGIIMVFLILFSPKSLAVQLDEENFSFHCEYETEIAPEKIDSEIPEFVEALEKMDDVIFVHSDVKKGSAEFILKFDKKKLTREELWDKILEEGKHLSGFLYTSNIYRKDVGKIMPMEIAITGDDIKECRRLAEECAAALSKSPYFAQTVLNFKEEETFYGFFPEKSRLTANKITVEQLANSLRLLLFSPVISKWNGPDGEKDIRLYSKNLENPEIEKIKNLTIPGPEGLIPLKSLGEFIEIKAIGKIYRKNGRHCAYLTTSVLEKSTEKSMNRIRETLANVNFPKGYSFDFSHSVKNMKKNILTLITVFAICMVFLLLLLLGMNEEILPSLIIISVIPASLFIPMAIKFLATMPVTGGDVTGMVAVSGISVNSAIYIFDVKKHSTLVNIKEIFFTRLKSLYATSITGIIGALPLMVFSEESFVSSVGFFMFWGNLGSITVTIFCLPAVISRFFSNNYGSYFSEKKFIEF